jgi:type II restriction/modification system DNA methylase subunit YeeA
VEILGSAYEQFLGKQIKLSASHKAVVEEKPEVRKAGGVYYTPQYIVDYIVQQTVGKLVEGKKPEQVAKLRIVDPACGSGSFLIGAYNYLLNWHQAYYKPEWDRLSAIASAPITTKSTERCGEGTQQAAADARRRADHRAQETHFAEQPLRRGH